MDKLFILPHTHYDAEVFLTREEYLEVGYKVLIDVLNALRADPDYKFSLDQSAFVQPFLKAYPECRDFFIEMVRCGRLEIIGGMHVMSDLNVASGESIVRQFELGRGYFSREPGADVKTGWMIDTFGHCLQMPQIMRKCGFDNYMFSRVAGVKHSEFYWQGIDGTKILTHWMPYHYAVFSGSPGWFEGFCGFVRERYGLLRPYSAGGSVAAPEGGDFTYPARHEPEFVRRWNADPARPFDLAIGTPGDFFAALAREGAALDVVTDEFNPVFQGCYSARIRVKQQNRRLEGLLYGAEAWNAVSKLCGGEDMSGLIGAAWEPVLFSQVHDVMGGVQMDKVFENVQKRWHQAENLVGLSTEASLDKLAEKADTRGPGIPLAVFNPLCWERTDKARVTVAFDQDDAFEPAIVDSRGNTVPMQAEVLERYQNGAVKQAGLLFVARCPALGYEVYHVLKNAPSPYKNPWRTGKWYGYEELDEAVLENEYYRVKCDQWKGCITSLILKETGGEYIDPGMPCGNMLVKDEDNGDFWEIGAPLRGGANRPIHRILPLDPQKANTELSIDKGGLSWIAEGDLCSDFAFVQKAAYGDFTTHVRLYAGLKRIEIETELTNREKNVRYRIAFPTGIKNGAITHEIPFGSIERPEGEYPAINWADYSAPGRGLGLLNRGLPGNATVGGNMLLSVMKCTSFVTYGDAGGFDAKNSSEGGFELNVPHAFQYALVPHKGDWREAELPRQGQEFNHPLVVRKASAHGGSLPASMSFLRLDSPQAAASCVRLFEGGLMLRVWETTGRAAPGVRVSLAWPVASAAETNMLGLPMADAAPVAADGNSIGFDLKPYEVRTFVVKTGA